MEKLNNEEIKVWLEGIKNGTADYTELEPCAYKYFDKYNALIHEYRYGMKDSERCKQEALQLRAEYNRYIDRHIRHSEQLKQFAENVRRSELLRIELYKAKDLQTALDIALEICEITTEEHGLKARVLGGLK